MENFFLWLFSSKKNGYLVWGLILTILGIILTPVIIGIPIAGIGFTLFAIGALMSYDQRIENGRKIIEKAKQLFSKKKASADNKTFHSPHAGMR